MYFFRYLADVVRGYILQNLDFSLYTFKLNTRRYSNFKPYTVIANTDTPQKYFAPLAKYSCRDSARVLSRPTTLSGSSGRPLRFAGPEALILNSTFPSAAAAYYIVILLQFHRQCSQLLFVGPTASRLSSINLADFLARKILAAFLLEALLDILAYVSRILCVIFLCIFVWHCLE